MSNLPPSSVVGEWLQGTGPDSDIVISSRIRLARNVEGFPLKARLEQEDETLLCEHLRGGIDSLSLGDELAFVGLRERSEIERLVLVERHVISLEHSNAEGERGVICDPGGSLALMLNEEDHLRIQVLASGLALDETFERAQSLSHRLESVLKFAYHQRFGFLTSCPTNVGTGMRISVMLHLPALATSKQIDKVFNSVAKMNLAVRGFYGEGTKALSHFYQISNQVTLGKTPEELLVQVRRVLPKIVTYERELRRQLVESEQQLLEDRVWRSLGTLQTARQISSEEAFELLSLVRMGVHLGLLPQIDIPLVNELFMMSQPGHLQHLHAERSLEASERDRVRAELIRARLNP